MMPRVDWLKKVGINVLSSDSGMVSLICSMDLLKFFPKTKGFYKYPEYGVLFPEKNLFSLIQ